MPTTDIDQRVKRIADLDNAQVTILRDDGITTEDDLRFISFVDINQTILIVKRRKLDLICKYLLANGDVLTAATKIEIVQASACASQNPPQQQAAGANAQVAAVNNVDTYAPKVHTNPLPKFSGDPVDEDWERRSGATIRQTAYKHYLTRAATIGDPAEEAHSSELYYMLQSCVGEGHALNTVEKSKDSNNGVACGYLAWKALNDWYMDPSQTSTMVASSMIYRLIMIVLRPNLSIVSSSSSGSWRNLKDLGPMIKGAVNSRIVFRKTVIMIRKSELTSESMTI